MPDLLDRDAAVRNRACRLAWAAGHSPFAKVKPTASVFAAMRAPGGPAPAPRVAAWWNFAARALREIDANPSP